MTKDKARIEEVYTRSKNKSTPVLLKFQNGGLTKAHKDSTAFFPAKCESDLKTKHAVVVTSGNVYTGPVSDGSQKLVDTYICIRNKTTDKVRILPIDQVKLINHVYEDKEKTKFAMLSKDTARETVMRIFGGRREMRMLNHRDRNNVSIDVFREQLETTVEKSQLTANQEPVVNTEVVIDSIRPTFNKDATNLASVFNVYDVIPLELIDRLDEEVGVIMATNIEDIPISSEYLKSLIVKLKKGSQSSQTILKMKMVLYMDGLQKVIKSKQKQLNKLEISKITEKVETDIRQRFSSEKDSRHMRTSTTDEKALCYFLVLAFLLSDDYVLDLNILSTELGLSKVKIVKYGNLVNAMVRPKTNFLALRLPSNVRPSVAFGGKRKRK